MKIITTRLYSTKDNSIKGGFQLCSLSEGLFFPCYLGEIDTSIIIKESNLTPYSPKFRIGEIVGVKTKEEFSRYFRVEKSPFSDGFFVTTRCYFSTNMNKLSGKIFKIKSIEEEGVYILDECKDYANDETAYHLFDADMLTKIPIIFKEV